MDGSEDRLALGKKLIAEARRVVERERIVVRRRELAGLDTAFSESILQTFELSLAKLEADLAAALATNPQEGKLRLH